MLSSPEGTVKVIDPWEEKNHTVKGYFDRIL
jgi:hypothetical protein